MMWTIRMHKCKLFEITSFCLKSKKAKKSSKAEMFSDNFLYLENMILYDNF